jgi:hypothetical protein
LPRAAADRGVGMTRLARFEWLARLGYIARGAVYLLVGWFSLAAAWSGARPTDAQQALLRILDQPFGEILLGAIAVGLVFYALWRLVQGALDLDDHGTDAKGLAIRGALLISAVLHITLAFFALSIAMGGQASGEGETASRDWTAWLMSQPFGRWLVAAVGAAVIVAGLAHFAKAWRKGYRRHLKADRQTMRAITVVARIGLAARGVVFCLTGAFFVLAAWHADASESGGLGKALLTVQAQPYGPWLLAAIAAGLFAFGTYSVIEGFYRRIDSPRVVQRLGAVSA